MSETQLSPEVEAALGQIEKAIGQGFALSVRDMILSEDTIRTSDIIVGFVLQQIKTALGAETELIIRDAIATSGKGNN